MEKNDVFDLKLFKLSVLKIVRINMKLKDDYKRF